MATVIVQMGICPDCGNDYEPRFGKHGCNMRRVHVHNKAIIIDPFEEFSSAVLRLYERLEDSTMKSAEYWDLSGGEGPNPYRRSLNQIDAAIGMLKRQRSEMQRLARHVHDYNENDYCTICGADGRA